MRTEASAKRAAEFYGRYKHFGLGVPTLDDYAEIAHGFDERAIAQIVRQHDAPYYGLGAEQRRNDDPTDHDYR